MPVPFALRNHHTCKDTESVEEAHRTAPFFRMSLTFVFLTRWTIIATLIQNPKVNIHSYTQDTSNSINHEVNVYMQTVIRFLPVRVDSPLGKGKSQEWSRLFAAWIGLLCLIDELPLFLSVVVWIKVTTEILCASLDFESTCKNVDAFSSCNRTSRFHQLPHTGWCACISVGHLPPLMVEAGLSALLWLFQLFN